MGYHCQVKERGFPASLLPFARGCGPPKTAPWTSRRYACQGRTVSKCARACGILSRMSRNTTSKAVPEKPAFFLTGGQSLFYGRRFSAETFFCARFCAVARAWKGLFPVVVFHPGPRRKSGFPGLCQPVAHACKPKRNPAIFRFKICGFPGVAATTRRSLSGRTCRRSEPFSL